MERYRGGVPWALELIHVSLLVTHAMQKPKYRYRETIFLILHDLEVGCTLFSLDQGLSGVLDISRTLRKSHCQNKTSLVMSEIDTHCHSFFVAVVMSLVTYAIPVWRFNTAPLLNRYPPHLRNSC